MGRRFVETQVRCLKESGETAVGIAKKFKVTEIFVSTFDYLLRTSLVHIYTFT